MTDRQLETRDDSVNEQNVTPIGLLCMEHATTIKTQRPHGITVPLKPGLYPTKARHSRINTASTG